MIRVANAMATNRRLKKLNLSFNENYHNFSAAEWDYVSIILQNPNSELEELDSWGHVINDRIMVTLASSLANNNTLKELMRYHLSRESVTATGWDTLLSVVCNTSNIMATYHFNHTPEKVCEDSSTSKLPEDIRSLLHLNLS